MSDLSQFLLKPEFPRSSRYDTDWMLDNQMGPNALWLTEWVCESLSLTPGMRVLDLGCGRAMSSIFLAREFDVRVWATDLWITPDHNWKRVIAAGVADAICPLRAEAHALPFAEGFFDCVISIDAYQYFGTDVMYLPYLSRFVRPGGTIAIAVPALMQPITEVPEHLTTPQSNGKVFWSDDCWSFRTADAWRELWERSSTVENVRVDVLADGARHWRDFELAAEAAGKGIFPSDAEALEKDGGRTIGFIRAVATRTSQPKWNLYDPSLGAAVGVDG